MTARMPRQRLGVSEELLRVPPPPLPVFPAPYSVRYADPVDDAELISRWMNLPHLAETWGYAYPADQWRRHMEVQYASNYSRPYVISIGDRPMAYMELFRAAQDDVATLYDAHPYDVGLHIAFGEVDLLKQGHGFPLFNGLVEGVFDVEPECRRIIGDTNAAKDSNGRRAWERRDGTFLGEHYISKWDQHIALFAKLRTPEDMPRSHRPQA